MFVTTPICTGLVRPERRVPCCRRDCPRGALGETYPAYWLHTELPLGLRQPAKTAPSAVPLQRRRGSLGLFAPCPLLSFALGASASNNGAQCATSTHRKRAHMRVHRGAGHTDETYGGMSGPRDLRNPAPSTSTATGASHGWRTCSRSQVYNLRASRTCWTRPTLWVEGIRQASGRPRQGAPGSVVEYPWCRPSSMPLPPRKTRPRGRRANRYGRGPTDESAPLPRIA